MVFERARRVRVQAEESLDAVAPCYGKVVVLRAAVAYQGPGEAVRCTAFQRQAVSARTPWA